MQHIEGQDRDQLLILSLEQMVHPEAFVRIIDAFVDMLDLEALGFSSTSLHEQGRPPYHPAHLMKLYLYGYQYGIRSCRKLEHATMVNVEVMWLLKSLHPHYKTIANFRKENAKPFRQVFRQFVLLLKEWKLVEGKYIAIDSFKIRAQNSLKNNFNEKKIHRHLDYLDHKINDYCEQLEQEDDPEARAQLVARVEKHTEQWNAYCQIGEELLRTEEDQLSVTDPDARAVVLHRNIVNVGYNIQAVSDAKYKLLVGMDTGSVNDTHALSGMVRIAQHNLHAGKMQVLADKGYHTGAQIAKCEELNVTTYIAPKASSSNKTHAVFPAENFTYHPGSDTYRCPQREILRSNGAVYERKSFKKDQPAVQFKHYKTIACKTCPLRAQCTTSASGRIIQRNLHQSAIDRNNQRVLRDPEYYKQRQQLIEHQFGTLKRQWGFTHTLVRSKDKVLGEVSLMFTVYNLRRSLSILGFHELIGRLRALFSTFWLKLTLSCSMDHMAMRELRVEV